MELKLLTYNIYSRPPFINARGNDYKDRTIDIDILFFDNLILNN